MKLIRKAVLFLLVAMLLGGIGWFAYARKSTAEESTDRFLSFEREIYESIQKNYWNTISDADLSNIFKRAMEKISGAQQTLTSPNKDGVIAALSVILEGKNDEEKKKFVTELGDIVLANLQPFGRSRLYGQKEEKALRDTVANVDPGKDLYADLGVEKDAPKEEIEKAFTAKKSELEKEGTPEAEEKLEKLTYAKNVLTKEETRERYNEKKVEPTVFGRKLSPKVYYMYLSQISPTTFEEFIETADKTDAGLDSLIIDVRGNIGGAVDIMQYFLGMFIGVNQYAYDFYHRDEYEPYRTKVPKLPSLSKFKRLVLLTDGGTQSSGEVLAAAWKRFNIGLVVGSKTKGWGTIENTFPLETKIADDETYMLFLVHSITIRDDGEPIEGRGVDPTLDISNKNWTKEFASYYNHPELLSAVKEILAAEPKKK